jgi:hypothetical protein
MQHTGLPDDVAANIDHIKRLRSKIQSLEEIYNESADALIASIKRHRWSVDEAILLSESVPRGRGFRFMGNAIPASGWNGRQISQIIKDRRLRQEQGNQFIPRHGTPCVYVLRLHGVTVYVGRSINVRERMKTHRKTGNTYDAYEIYICESKKEMIDLEAVLIQQHRPIRNRRIERRPA